MKNIVLISILASFLLACSPASQPASQQFQSALSAQAAGLESARAEFAASARLWSEMIKAGRGDTAALAFNASQAWQLAGQADQARLYSLLAHLAQPGESKIGAWYQSLRRESNPAPAPENLDGYALSFWGRELWTLGGGLVLLVLLLASLAAWQFRQRHARLRRLAWLCGLVFCLLFAYSWVGKLSDGLQPLVFLPLETSLRQGDSRGFPQVEPSLPAGSPARLLESRGGWGRIRSAGGAEGWLPLAECWRLADRLP